MGRIANTRETLDWVAGGGDQPCIKRLCIVFFGKVFLSTLRLLIFVFSQSSFTFQTKYQMLIVVKSSLILEISFFMISSLCCHCLRLTPPECWKYWRTKLKKCLKPFNAVRNPVGNIFHGKDICQPAYNVLASVLTKMPSLEKCSSWKSGTIHVDFSILFWVRCF